MFLFVSDFKLYLSLLDQSEAHFVISMKEIISMDKSVSNRVPPIVLSYWIIKVASTTLGETGADHFSHTMNMGYATTSLLFMGIFLFFLLIKLAIRKYDPVIYWLVFTSTSIVGTAMSDFMDRTLGLGYLWGSVILTIGLLLTLAFWHFYEKSISVENITTLRLEIFYWVAFLFANTLGTAAGDYLADDAGLGFAMSAALISGILGITVLLHSFTEISPILLFWIAFVFTRPFGATFGDFLTKSADQGGLDFGTLGSSVLFMIMLVIFVGWEHRAHKERIR